MVKILVKLIQQRKSQCATVEDAPLNFYTVALLIVGSYPLKSLLASDINDDIYSGWWGYEKVGGIIFSSWARNVFLAHAISLWSKALGSRIGTFLTGFHSKNNIKLNSTQSSLNKSNAQILVTT